MTRQNKEFYNQFEHLVLDYSLTEEERIVAKLCGKTEGRARMEKFLSLRNPPLTTKGENNDRKE